jgi:hypothetical protein
VLPNYQQKDEDTSMELLPPMQWAALGSRGCLEKASDLFAEATLIQRRVLTVRKCSRYDKWCVDIISSTITS